MANKQHLRPLYGPLFLVLLFTGLCVQAQAPANGSSNNNHLSGHLNPYMAIIILMLVSAFFFLSFFFIYIRQRGGADGVMTSLTEAAATDVGHSRRQHGLDFAVLETFPVFVYSEVKEHKMGKGVLECAVCIDEFDDDDTIRLLTKCHHVFHLECVDVWLATHVTCPVCRTNYAAVSAAFPAAVHPGTDETIMVREQQEVATDAPMANHVAISVDDMLERQEEIREMVQIASRIKRNGSRRSRRLSRSHSTGHSFVLDGQDRYTLRLSENTRKDVIAAGKLRQVKSFAVTGYTDQGDSRVSRGIGEGSSRRGRTIQLGRSDRRLSFFLRSLSAKIPSWGGSKRREEGPSGKQGSKRWKLGGVTSGKDLLASRGDGSKTKHNVHTNADETAT